MGTVVQRTGHGNGSWWFALGTFRKHAVALAPSKQPDSDRPHREVLPKVGCTAPALVLDLTTSRRGHLRSISYINAMGFVWGGSGRALMQFMHFPAIFAMLAVLATSMTPWYLL